MNPTPVLPRRAVLSVLAAAVAAGTLAGCGQEKPKFQSIDLTGADYAKDFRLTDHHGQARSLQDFRGKVVVVFFGFTQCPDVCPTALLELAEVRRQLGADGDKVQGIFITVDPERDTPAALKDYLSSFDPRISGLSGARAEVDAALKAYRVYAKKQPQENGEYSMDHSAIIYLMDKQGRFVNALNMQQPPEAVAREIQRQM